MNEYKVMGYLITKGNISVLTKVFYVSATCEKHAENKVKYIYKKNNRQRVIVTDVKKVWKKYKKGIDKPEKVSYNKYIR